MPALTKEQEESFKKTFNERQKQTPIPQSKADVQYDKPTVDIPENINPVLSGALGVSNAMELGEKVITPNVVKYLHKKKYGTDMPDEQANQVASNLYNKAYEQNPMSYGAGRVVGEVVTGTGLSKVAEGLGNIPRVGNAIKNYAEPIAFGGAAGVNTALQGGNAEDVARNSLIGGAAVKILPKAIETIGKIPSATRDLAKGATRFFTGTTKELSNFIDTNPNIAKQITQKGFPEAEQLIQEKIQQTKPIVEQMRLFDDANKMRTEAVNHLKDTGYEYDPIKLAQTIDSKIANIVTSSKASEAVKAELKSHADFYKNKFKDDQGNIVPMQPDQIANAVKDFQMFAKNAYKEGNPPAVQKAYREIATELRKEVGRDVPKFDQYMGQAEKLVNKGLFLKTKLAEKNQGINWQNVTEQEALGMPVSEQKLQSMIFDRKRGQIGTGMQRDRDLSRLNQILPQNAKITPEDLLRVQGRKLMENPRSPGTGSAPILTGVPFGIGASAIAHNMGADYLTSSGIGSVVSTLAGQKIRQEGPGIATKGYMAIKKAEDASNKLKNASTNLINKFIGTKYQKVLQDAAMKGSQSLASTIFMLKSSDNDFRQQYNEIQGLDK
jgi:hypothetical protein